MKTLAIETSCDDTSIWIVSLKDDIFTVENLLAYSQVPDHQKFGWVVPEIASRLHSEKIIKVIENIWYDKIKDVDFISVTIKPWLPGSLVVWKAVANLLSEYFDKPLIEINHIHGHVFSLFLEKKFEDINFPMVVLTASGGHNDLYLIEKWKMEDGKWKSNNLNKQSSFNNIDNLKTEIIWNFKITRLWSTLDDAAWECFDKISRMLGGPYPGWPRISQKATLWKARPDVKFPRIFLSSHELNFSFSGMKSHIHYFLGDLEKKWIKLDEEMINDVAYEFQEAIVEVLWKKLIKAWIEFWVKTLGIVWWVSANDRLFEYTTNLLIEKQNKLKDWEKWEKDEKRWNKVNPSFEDKSSIAGEKGKENFILDMQVIRPVKKLYSTDNAAMIGLVGLLLKEMEK